MRAGADRRRDHPACKPPRLLDGERGGCDGQFLFSCDIWGTHDRHYPRHAKKYRDFFTEGVVAMQEYRQDVLTGAFPTDAHVIQIRDEESPAGEPAWERPAGKWDNAVDDRIDDRITASLIQHGREPTTIRGPAERGGTRYDREY